MPTELQRLVYASQWAPGLDRRISGEVRRIVQASIPRNRDSDLSGLLLAHDGWFVQALEGGRPAIAAAMDRIFRDRRHAGLHILSSGAVEDRAFRDWSMAAAMAGPEVQPFLTELGMAAEFDARRLDGPAAFRLMLALAEAERAHGGSRRAA
jgi:hypothetical protein